jgi:hypothetical protein
LGLNSNCFDIFSISRYSTVYLLILYVSDLTHHNKWTTDSKRKNIKEIDNVADTVNNPISRVVNPLILNLSNALAERLNGKIQELRTVAKGYRTFANIRSALLFFHGDLDLYSH